jgi:translocation and assembly module TamA
MWVRGLRSGLLYKRLPAVLLAVVVLAAVPNRSDALNLFGWNIFGTDETAEDIGIVDPVSYETTIVAANADPKLVERLNEASLLINQQELPPSGLVGLLQRAKDDRANLVAKLYESGLYGAVVRIFIDGRNYETIGVTEDFAVSGRTLPVTIEVTPGPEFTFGNISITGVSGQSQQDAIAEAGLIAGRIASSTTIVSAEAAVVTAWQKLGHPYAEMLDRTVVADHATRTLDVELAVRPGPKVSISGVDVMGEDQLEEDFIIQQADIPLGEVYHPEILERARKRLSKIEALASVTLRTSANPDASGGAPVIIEVSERKRRTIGTGAFYSSNEGLGGEVFWVHRNLFGRAETLRLEAAIGGLLMADELDEYDGRVSALYGVPGILGPDIRWDFKGTLLQEHTDPYDRRGAVAESIFTYDINDHLSLASGVVFDWARIDDAFGRNTYTLVTTPLTVRYDTRDDLLDPTSGLFGRLTLEPQYEITNSSLYFMTDAELRGYMALDENERFVLAARGLAGTIWGADLEDIPAHRRFYAGGGGSVRGYDYLNIGPRVPGFGPTGGLARIEGSVEARIKVTDTIGIVPFVDAGYVTETSGFGGDDAFQIGVGIGLRYYTAVGPLRFDLAVPLDPRSGDPDFSFYFGIGQAF